jgi:hypothetical protein
MKANKAAKLTDWQLIFAQSKVNGAFYLGEQLSRYQWAWPKDTYFQRRLHAVRFPESLNDIWKTSAP